MIEIDLPVVAYDVGLLLVRLIVGFSFILGAMNKSKNIRKFARQNGLPYPLGLVVTIAEFAGGLGLLIGVLPQLAAVGLMLLMVKLRCFIFSNGKARIGQAKAVGSMI